MRIFNYYPSRLRVKDISGVVDGTVAIVERHNPVIMGVELYFTLLVEQQEQLVFFADPRVSHPLSDAIITDRKRMVELCKAIVHQARTVKSSASETISVAAALIAPLITMYLMKIVWYIPNVDTFVKKFLAGMDENELLSNAATTIGIRVNVNELKLVKSRLDTNVSLRRIDIAARIIVQAKMLQGPIIESVTNLLKAIELAKVIKPTVDYAPMISELNVLFDSYNVTSRRRDTRNQNEALKNETAAMSTKTTATAD